MDKYEKKALIVLFLWSLFCSLFVFFVTADIATIEIDQKQIFRFLRTLIILLVASYFYYFRPNMASHENLLEKNGEEYLQKLEARIKDEGFHPLVMRKWFVKLDKGEIES